MGSVGKHSWACHSEAFSESEPPTDLLLLHDCFSPTHKHTVSHRGSEHMGAQWRANSCKDTHLNDLFGVQSEVKISKNKVGHLLIPLVRDPGKRREQINSKLVPSSSATPTDASAIGAL